MSFAPVTAFTGLPGNGKTLYMLWEVERIRLQSVKDGKPLQVFYARVNGIEEAGKLPWHPIDAYDWYKVPPGSIVVLDEVQEREDPADPKSRPFFGELARGEPVPLWVSQLATLRHSGIRLYVTSQDPMLLAPAVRRLIGRHLHMWRNFGLPCSTVNEYQGCKFNVSTSRAGALSSRKWWFPKEVYSWYISAADHSIKVRIPRKLVYLVMIPPLLVGLIYFAWTRYLDPTRKHALPSLEAAAAAGGGAGGPVLGGSGSGLKLTPAAYVASYQPRVAGLEYTAPVYDEVTKPVVAPYPAACVATETRCKCYTQQATVLQVADALCRQVVAGGFFIPWQVPTMPARSIDPGARVASEAPGGAVGWDTARPALRSVGGPSASVLGSGSRGDEAAPVPSPASRARQAGRGPA